jgi:hypothetical protein
MFEFQQYSFSIQSAWKGMAEEEDTMPREAKEAKEAKQAKHNPADALVKNKAGIELTEQQLDQAAGGACANGKHIAKAIL